MGFFNDLKEDLASAVNELTDEKAERDVALSKEHLKEEYGKIEKKEKKNKKEKKPNSNLEREIQNILNGIDENTPIEDISEFEEENDEETIETEENVEIIDETEVSNEEVYVENEETQNVSFANENETLTVIGVGTSIKGGIEAEGSVEIDGIVDGDVKAGGELIVNGTVIGNVEGLILSLNGGKIKGNAKAYNGIYISNDSVLIGDIESNEAEIGGAVKGKIDVNGPVVLKTGAKVLGDIDCKCVQINNGAVIEGKCSQKYADISPSAFFENL